MYKNNSTLTALRNRILENEGAIKKKYPQTKDLFDELEAQRTPMSLADEIQFYKNENSWLKQTDFSQWNELSAIPTLAPSDEIGVPEPTRVHNPHLYSSFSDFEPDGSFDSSFTESGTDVPPTSRSQQIIKYLWDAAHGEGMARGSNLYKCRNNTEFFDANGEYCGKLIQDYENAWFPILKAIFYPQSTPTQRRRLSRISELANRGRAHGGFRGRRTCGAPCKARPCCRASRRTGRGSARPRPS